VIPIRATEVAVIPWFVLPPTSRISESPSPSSGGTTGGGDAFGSAGIGREAQSLSNKASGHAPFPIVELPIPLVEEPLPIVEPPIPVVEELLTTSRQPGGNSRVCF
jgi:hypothetical protein